METIIYIRTSTEDQNPENQMKDCLAINSYGEYEVIEDKQSAWKDDKEREGFSVLFKKIKSGEVKHLIVWDFDRVYRNRIRFKQFLELLKAYNVKLHSYRQAWLEDIHKVPPPWNDIVYDLMINVYGHLAEEESNKKSQRTKAAIRIKDGKTYSRTGLKWGRRVKPVHKDYILELKAQGLSIVNIAKKYNEREDFKAKISHQTVFNILKELKGGQTNEKEISIVDDTNS